MSDELMELLALLREIFTGDNLMILLSLCVSIPMAVRQWKMVMNGRTRKDKFIETSKKNGCVTTGVCVDMEYLVGDSDANTMKDRSGAIAVKYQYQVDGIIYHKHLLFRNPGSRQIDYPNMITIYYAKERPKKVITSVEWPAVTSKYNPGRRQHALLISFGLWFVLTMIVFWILKLRFLW